MKKKHSPIGIMSAMPSEISMLLKLAQGINKETIAAVEYYEGTIHGIPVVLCWGGVGKVNAAMHTQIMIDRYAPSVIIQNGVAGALSDSLHHFDLVIGNELLYHDMPSWICHEFGPLQETYAADEELLRLALQAAPFGHVGRIATGDIFVNSASMKEEIASRTKAVCVEMEGCAVAHTATLNSVPFIVLRTISDSADDDAHETYDEFERKAADRSGEIVIRMLELISKKSC